MKLSNSDLSTLIFALGSQSDAHAKLATELEGKAGTPTRAEKLRDFRAAAVRGRELRARLALQLHAQGGTDCELAHGGINCPL
jgi:hypothetical protein